MNPHSQQQVSDRKKGVSSLPFQRELSKKIAEFQAPFFQGGANPKSRALLKVGGDLRPGLRPASLPRPKIQNPKSGDQSSQAGFTIVESLLAIIMVSILLAAISPVLVLATANRVQAKRVEVATNAAKAYIDRIRAGAYSSPTEITLIQDIIDDRRLNQVNAPVASGNLTCIANDYCTQPSTGNYLLYCVDGEGDGVCKKNSMKDMIIQVSAYQPNPSSPPSLDLGYEVGIRVYRADGFADIGPLKKSNPQIKATARTYTGGMGDRKAPQIEMQTEIVSNSTKYEDYCTRIGGCS